LQRSIAHEWFNTVVAVIALLVSGLSAYFTWKGNEARQEALSVVVRPDLDCRTEYQSELVGAKIGLCWAVTLGNKSENRLSIVALQVFNIQNGRLVWIGGDFQNLEAENGSPLALPIVLDGGEARVVVVRAPVVVPLAVAHQIAQMQEFQNNTLGSLPLESVQTALAMAKLDFIGNKVEPIVTNGKYSGFTIGPPVLLVINQLTLTTVRGATFSAQMSYPPPFDSGYQDAR
jgi:hypothetical protein